MNELIFVSKLGPEGFKGNGHCKEGPEYIGDVWRHPVCIGVQSLPADIMRTLNAPHKKPHTLGTYTILGMGWWCVRLV